MAQRAFPKLRGKLTVDKEGEDAFFEELDKGVEEKELNPTYMKIKRVFQEHGLWIFSWCCISSGQSKSEVILVYTINKIYWTS